MNDYQTVILWVKKFADDPLGQIFICDMQTERGIIRFNGGFIQTMAKGTDYFSFGVPVKEWLAEYGFV